LHLFRDIAGFCAHELTPNFGSVPVAPDRPYSGQCEQVP